MKLASLAAGLALAVAAQGFESANEPAGLAGVKRIYIDQLGGGRESDQMRDMIIASLQNSGLFIITENPDRADASLRGSSDDKIYKEEHHVTDSLGVHSNAGSGSSNSVKAAGSSSVRDYAGLGISESETSNIEERRHEAIASVRLVNEAGDVIWSTTQESTGGKFRGALADIADRIARRLVEDTKRARSARP